MDQDELDEAVQQFYARTYDEAGRLGRHAAGRLEFLRTQEIVRAATPAPARVLDVGGGTGAHAAALAEAGYAVTLVDPVRSHVAAASAYGTFEARIGDARALDVADDAFDAVLLCGPLYHLATRADRVRAVAEARRVCRPGGAVHAAAIPRTGTFVVEALVRETLAADSPSWTEFLRSGEPMAGDDFPAGHFHTAVELESELAEAGLRDVGVVGLEGPAGPALYVAQLEGADLAAALRLARRFSGVPAVRDLSVHLLGTGRA